MTVEEYPDGVPEQWRLDPGLFRSETAMARFTDVAPGIGLDVDDLDGGSIVEDFDRDGYLDVMVSSSRSTGPLRYFRNRGDGTFEERTEEAGLSGEVAALNITSADYDNDGYVDVLMLRGGWLGRAGELPNSLLRNNGDGTFTNVTVRAGLLRFHPTQTAAWLDFDGDGQLDLFTGNETGGDYFGQNETETVHRSELFRNNGDGTFTDCAGDVGIDVTGYVKAVAARDYDNDGWQDLFVAGYRVRHAGDVAADYLGLEHPAVLFNLYRNNGDGTFADATIQTAPAGASEFHL